MAQTLSEVADTHWSATNRAVDPEVIDQFFERYSTVNEMRSTLKKVEGGGRGIQVKLRTSGNDQVGSFSDYDYLDKEPINPVEDAFYNRRYYYCPIILSDTESWENSSAEKVFDEMEMLRDTALQSLLKAANEDYYTAQAGKNMLGFPDLIASASGTTLGGINSGTTTVWDNQRVTDAKTFLTNTATNVFDGIELWNDLLDLIMIQGASPRGRLFTTWGIVKAYRIALSSQGYARTTVENAGGIGGPLSPDFYGYKVIPDNDCTALHGYMIPGKNKNDAGVQLRVMSKVNFRKTPFVTLQANGQLAQLAYMVAGIQNTTSRRRENGVYTALTGT
tara:strand:- start:560 stop:1561 length:1002 start_codon:yes stop_codon:yes gene_type:complete